LIDNAELVFIGSLFSKEMNLHEAERKDFGIVDQNIKIFLITLIIILSYLNLSNYFNS